MLKTKIIAADLQNLTDARYFAAWLVDYISYNLTLPNVDLTQIKEIMDWVEGPISIAQYSGLEDWNDINEQLMALSIDHLIIGPFANKNLNDSDWQIFQTILLDETLDKVESNRTYIAKSILPFKEFTQAQIDHLKKLCTANKIYLDCGFGANDIDSILKLGIEGLVLRGGQEEKVGVKSYEDLDEIFEALEE